MHLQKFRELFFQSVVLDLILRPGCQNKPRIDFSYHKMSGTSICSLICEFALPLVEIQGYPICQKTVETLLSRYILLFRLQCTMSLFLTKPDANSLHKEFATFFMGESFGTVFSIFETSIFYVFRYTPIYDHIILKLY